MDAAHPAAEFVAALFGPHKNGRAYIASLFNVLTDDGKSGERHINTRSTAAVTSFAKRYNLPGRGCFVCVNPLKADADRRAAETVTEIICAHADIDFNKVETSPEELERIVIALALPPSWITHSGHGLHLYWFLKVAIEATPETRERHKALLRQIANIIGGDLAVCEPARLMRLPGTTNSKNGESLEVRVISARTDLRYELAEIEHWIATVNEPLIRRKIADPKSSNGASFDNPFLAFAEAHANEAPIDVESMLANIDYRGPGGGGNMHDTELRCSAAMLSRGEERDAVVERVLTAAVAAAARAGLPFDPEQERRKIEGMCNTWVEKKTKERKAEERKAEEREAKEREVKEREAKERASVPAEPSTTPIDLWNRFNPPPLPKGLLPPVLEEYAFKQGETMGADPAGIAAAALTVCAAIIPDCIRLKVKRYSDWTEATRLWAALVGDPSTKKTPIIYAVARPLYRIDSGLCRDYAIALAEWNALDRNEKRTTPRPLHTRVKLEDITVESAQEILRDNPNGVLCLRDELSGFFGSIDKYAGYRGAAMDRAFWLQAYNGISYSVDRIGRGSGYIEHLSISVLGGIQPEAMRKIVADTIDDGLIQRLTPVMLRQGGDDRDELVPDAIDEYERLIDRLYTMPQPTADAVFSDAARELRQELVRQHRGLVDLELINKKLAAHFGKYDGTFARLCLLWHCIENPGAPQIPEKRARRVADFMAKFLLPHAIAFYSDIYGLSEDHDRLTAIAGYVLAHGIDQLTNRIVQRGDRTMRGLKKQDIEGICHQLSALGWVAQVPGRRSSDPPRWDVNPEVHRLFKERAVQEAARRQHMQEELARKFVQEKPYDQGGN